MKNQVRNLMDDFEEAFVNGLNNIFTINLISEKEFNNKDMSYLLGQKIDKQWIC
jgi:hypothetical protein